MKHNRKLQNVMGKDFDMSQVTSEGDVRPGSWRSMLRSPQPESEMNKHNHVPALIQDKIVGEVADGARAKDIEEKYELRDGYVRDTLIRKFGSIEGMKKALKAQCFENAIALNAWAIQNIRSIAPAQALMGAKVMVDAGLALDKSDREVVPTVDFAALAALGDVLERVEKRISPDNVRELS
jgi:hypothetical protein